MDRGDNGIVSVRDVRVVETNPNRKVGIRGIDNHHASVIPLATGGGVTATMTDEIIVIMHQCPCHGRNKINNSSPQIEYYKKIVDDHYIKVGGFQHISTLDKHKTHMSIRRVSPYMPLHPCADKEWSALPHVMLISDVDWDPTFLDY